MGCEPFQLESVQGVGKIYWALIFKEQPEIKIKFFVVQLESWPGKQKCMLWRPISSQAALKSDNSMIAGLMCGTEIIRTKNHCDRHVITYFDYFLTCRVSEQRLVAGHDCAHLCGEAVAFPTS